MSQECLTVSELNNFIRDVISSGFPQPMWICGEIQGYDRSKDKKHVFFELCEKDQESNEIVARTGLVIFANTRLKIDQILKRAENAFVLKDDIEVKFLCKVDFYPGHGQIRLIVESIDPIYTLGKIAQDRQRLIAGLKQKGILDKNKILALPRVPLQIGLITSYDSAAYHDFTDELKRSSFGFKVFVCNTIMQGKNAEGSVVRSLKVLNRLAHLDAIVITRGGGSIAELACFDSEAIALAIAQSRLPILSGIGHEINTTVTDLAAHTFAKTPTAVAQLLAGRVQEFLLHLEDKYEDLLRLTQQSLDGQRMKLKDYAGVVHNGTVALVNDHKQAIARMAEALERIPLALLKESRNQLARHEGNLNKTIYLHLQKSRTKINNYQKLIEMADPKKILKRGFTITRDVQGKAIRSKEEAHRAKVVTTVFADGQITSEVRSK